VTVLHRLRARNIATASNNKIHDDTVARQYGFEGGLVPGVEVYAYATHPVVARFGVDWLERGTAHVRLHKPVYDGREVTVEADTDAGADDGELALVVRDDSGTDCATATARLGSDNPPDARDFPEAPLPDPVPRATADALNGAAHLGSITSIFDADRADEYLEAISETLPVYREQRIAHPAWLLRRANRILAANVRLGPWIHVESDASYFGLVHDGETLSTRGRVVRVWEQREHKFVTIDVGMFAGSDIRPVVRVTHTAIYEPRSR
jgi:acyl dehydratase